MIGAIIGGVAAIGSAILGGTLGSKDTARQLDAAELAAAQAEADRKHQLELAKLQNKQLLAQQLIQQEQAANAQDLAKLGIIGVSIVTLGAAGVAVVLRL